MPGLCGPRSKRRTSNRRRSGRRTCKRARVRICIRMHTGYMDSTYGTVLVLVRVYVHFSPSSDNENSHVYSPFGMENLLCAEQHAEHNAVRLSGVLRQAVAARRGCSRVPRTRRPLYFYHRYLCLHTFHDVDEKRLFFLFLQHRQTNGGFCWLCCHRPPFLEKNSLTKEKQNFDHGSGFFALPRSSCVSMPHIHESQRAM